MKLEEHSFTSRYVSECVIQGSASSEERLNRGMPLAVMLVLKFSFEEADSLLSRPPVCVLDEALCICYPAPPVPTHQVH